MKLCELLNVVENNQRLVFEVVNTPILNIRPGSGNFQSIANKFDDKLKPYYDVEVYSVSAGPNETLCIRT